MMRSGICSTISASHSSSLPPTVARQRSVFSSSCTTSFTPSMNRGKLSNCVHWSYASLIGTSTTMSFCMLGISLSLSRLAAGDDLRDRAVPALEEVVGVEHVVARERRDQLTRVALHHGHAVLTAHAAGETHDERRRLGRD